MSIEEERQTVALDRKRRAQRVINAYHVIFSGPDGALVLGDLTTAFGFNLPAFLPTATTPGQPIHYDTHYAAVRDGQRSILLHIQAKLEATMTGEGNITDPPEVLTGTTQ